jgi:two-component system, chemotaxis family, sensor kinase CheA
MDLTKYEKIFTQESEKYLEELDRLLISVEKDPSNLALWADIHGKIHSIKGMSSALSLEKIASLSHAMEKWCKEFQQDTVEPQPSAIQLIFQGGDLLRLLVARMDEIGCAEDQNLYDTLISQFKKGPDELAVEVDTGAPPQLSIGSSAEELKYVRVKYSLIEELLGLSQEILFLENALPPLSLEQVSGGLKNWIDDYTSMLKGFHFRLAQLRLVSVADFADIFVKTIRNLAKENKKKVVFEVVGEALEADITLLDRLREPFVHIFRNAIAHGIEHPEERARLGKSAEGEIRLKATRKGDSLIIKLSDDGRGIDRTAITGYLKDKKSMREEEIARMPEQEFFDTILSPDFTSASKATNIAGRGIGMNVVAQAIEYLGGTITIDSVPEKGTEFTVKLPVSLSVVYAINFRLGQYNLSIPTSNVVSIDRREPVFPEDMDFYYDLKGLLCIKDDGRKESHVLKLRHPGEKYTEKGAGVEMEVAVDSIIGNKPIMVMPVGELLAQVRLFAGVGILENGDISILLDIENFPKGPGYWKSATS